MKDASGTTKIEILMAKVAMQTYILLQSRAETIPLLNHCIFCLVLLGVLNNAALYSGSII